MLLTPHGSVFLCENPFFQLHETQYWWEYKKTFQNIKNEISSECWENWIFCFIDLKVSESPIMLLLVPNWRAYLALWMVNSLSFISTTKVTLRNIQEQVKKAFCYQKLFWPFTVWINCSSDLKNFSNSRLSASNFKSFSRSLEQFFLTVGQNNFGNKIPLFTTLSMNLSGKSTGQ